MFCRYCGKEIYDEAVVCIGCGRAVSPTIKTKSDVFTSAEKWNDVVMTGLLIGTIFIPILGLIIGALNMNNNSVSQEKMGQAKILLVVACISFVISSIMLIVLFSAIMDS